MPIVSRISQDVEHSERRTLEIAALLSHQIRSPLYTIRNAVSQMNEECPPCTDQCRAFVRIIDRSTDRIVTLVERCLHLIELQEKKNVLGAQHILSVVDLQELIYRIVSSLTEENALSQPQIKVEIDASVSLPALVKADAFLLEQALANLIANALQYGSLPFGPEIPAVVVRLIRPNSVENSVLQIEVIDYGPGIAEEEQDLIFQPFYRVASSTLIRNSGSGLGLAIVKAIVESFDGQVAVISTVGQGSNFSLRLPAFFSAG